MFKKVLIPLDGSEFAEEVLETAVTIAKELILLRVLVPSEELVTVVVGEAVNVASYDERVHEAAREYLDGVAQKWGRADLPISIIVEVGHTSDVINRVARNEEVDLVLMSTHGRTGLSRFVYGSVTESVLSHAKCPIMAMRADRLIKNILVPLDGSILAERAIAPALDVARQSEANVTLFCVQPVEIDVSDENEALHPRVEQSGDELLNVEGYLKALSEKYSDGEVMVDWAASVGVPEEEIVAYALDEGVDLIAMSTHGRTGLSRLLYGSVAESVLRNTAGAVLVVRPE